jgi:hypothetical protein
LLLSQAFRWESLWRWDLGHNLLLSQAFRWESLWRWDLGFHGAFGYQGASFSKHFIFFLNLGYHGALSWISFLFSWISGNHRTFHDGISAITEPFTMEFRLSHSLSRWNFGYHRAFHDGVSAITEPFTMEFRLSRSLSQTFMNFFLVMEFKLSWNLSQTFTNFFLWWNSSYHGGVLKLSRIISYDGIQAITKSFSNFHEFFFHTIELRLQHSPLWNFSFTLRNFGNNGALSWNFSFTLWNFDYHEALFMELFFRTLELQPSRGPFMKFFFHTMELRL